jgi:hypothetical protein
MRGIMLGLLSVLLSSSAAADEIVLKNGKTVEWASMKDLGDTYDVETKTGERMKIDKNDIARVVVIPQRVEGPLTGASFSFDKKTKLVTRDLLAEIDPKRDTVTGDWKKAAGALNGVPVGGAIAKLQFAGIVLPDEYDITLVTERKTGANQLTISLFSPLGKRFNLNMDTLSSQWTGIYLAGGKQTEEKASIPGKFFETGKTRTLQIMVRKDAFVLQSDGKDYIVWKGDWSRVVAPDPNQWGVPNEKAMYLAVLPGATYSITRLTVTLPKL